MWNARVQSYIIDTRNYTDCGILFHNFQQTWRLLSRVTQSDFAQYWIGSTCIIIKKKFLHCAWVHQLVLSLFIYFQTIIKPYKLTWFECWDDVLCRGCMCIVFCVRENRIWHTLCVIVCLRCCTILLAADSTTSSSTTRFCCILSMESSCSGWRRWR